MKYTFLFLLFFLVGCSSSDNKDAWVNTNMRTLNTAKVTYDNRMVYVDIFTLRTSDSAFRMGNSSYFFLLPDNVFNDAKIVWKNPKYSLGDYNLKVFFYNQYLKDRFCIQLYCYGQGEIIDNSTPNKLGEKIATIQLAKNSNDFFVKWDTINSAIVTPEFLTSNSTWIMQDLGESK